ncbi:hypothetical protein COCC4DRAFT_33069, partial [Bipolaris maydis ATCC 48331]
KKLCVASFDETEVAAPRKKEKGSLSCGKQQEQDRSSPKSEPGSLFSFSLSFFPFPYTLINSSYKCKQRRTLGRSNAIYVPGKIPCRCAKTPIIMMGYTKKLRRLAHDS